MKPSVFFLILQLAAVGKAILGSCRSKLNFGKWKDAMDLMNVWIQSVLKWSKNALTSFRIDKYVSKFVILKIAIENGGKYWSPKSILWQTYGNPMSVGPKGCQKLSPENFDALTEPGPVIDRDPE